ncbi:HNH endonuclease signature motif containing protein [Actinopolymorpha rutila]|uniref:HNH nuclease domain-containing protein n=1 Tax=Actinopolymorpha rutila TaxID=446787 RepID=A0A852Z4J5_9ACTN|nr:HNH endonuclease signature motif containing protein [Actinopolymorpha rutila]NYH87751.1 hypothetical protein [Actinopolymorpha rutila]
MRSAEQDLPGGGGYGTVARLKAALGMFRAAMDEALSTPTACLEARELGELISELAVEKARADALNLTWVREAEARDVGKTTGAATTAAWLRTAQRMSKTEASATVGLARDLGRTVTLTAAALARGELSLKHAQVIAFAVKDLPAYVGVEQRVKAEEYLIEESRRRNPDDVRLLGRALLQVLAPEEWERRLGKELGDAERAAERKRSLRYLPNGIPGSETVVIKLPVVEMEQLRKLIEALIASDTRPDPDERPLDQKRGDAFAELVARMAEWEASPNRGRGRDCVTVTVGVDQLLTGLGFGTIDDLNPVRPMPCTCQTPDAKRQTQRKTRQQNTSANGTTGAKPTKPAHSNSADDTEDTRPNNSAHREHTNDTQPEPDADGVVVGPDVMPDSGGTTCQAPSDDLGQTDADTTTDQNAQPVKEQRPPDPHHPGGVADRIPEPREPGQRPQPNTETGADPTGEADPEVDAEPEGGAAGPEAAIDPHDGCQKCGGGGSARILGLRGEPLSVATIRRMACDANIIPVVLGGNGEVLDVGMADRFFTEPQRRALAIRDGSHCHFPDCQVPERRCVAHHMTAWDHFGPTDLANGVLLCKTHHTFVHHKGWQVRMGSHGHPEYIPPEWVDPHQKVRRP